MEMGLVRFMGADFYGPIGVLLTPYVLETTFSDFALEFLICFSMQDMLF